MTYEATDIVTGVGAGGVTGDIITDGAIGNLTAADILDWNLALNNGTTTLDLLGPLSGSNSQVGVSSALSATPTQLLVDFTGMFESFAQGALFQETPFVGGNPGLCFDPSSGQCTARVPVGSGGVEELWLANANISTTEFVYTDEPTGEQVIGTAAATPEPSTLALLGVGVIGIIGFRKALAPKPV